MTKAANDTMRAVRYDRYGPPEVLAVRTVPVPSPGAGEVLVKVYGTSVNPIEARIRAGKFRLASGWRFPRGIGEDFAGTVAAVGQAVVGVTVGQRVWGCLLGLNSATAAEYITVKAAAVAPAPAGHDLLTAAALPLAGTTALGALRAVRLGAGDRVLVVGASGGVGHAVVQLARARGATVAAVAGAGSADFCRKLGAEEVYDYAAAEPVPADQTFDAIVDCHGTSLRSYRGRLRRGGRMVTVAPGGIAFATLSALLPGPRVRVFVLRAPHRDLETLGGHVERGELEAMVERVYPLEEVADAHRSLETGHSQGKRVIRVSGD